MFGKATGYSEPTVSGPKSENWKKVMEEEIKSLMENKTRKLVDKPKDHRMVQCKWIYKLKESTNPNDPPIYKTRLVAMEFT